MMVFKFLWLYCSGGCCVCFRLGFRDCLFENNATVGGFFVVCRVWSAGLMTGEGSASTSVSAPLALPNDPHFVFSGPPTTHVKFF